MALTQITSDVISSNAISATMIANGSITSAHVANGAISAAHHDVASSNGTGAILVPVGNTAQRPATTQGYIRYNTTLGTLESANGTAWANVGSGSASSSSSAANLTSLTGNVFISSAGGVIDASNTTGALIIPTGTFAQRPANAPKGSMRWNSSNNYAEMFVGNSTWQSFASSVYLVDYLIVAGGGGGGGGRHCGGAGAGGMLSGQVSVVSGQAYSISVGRWFLWWAR